MAADGLICEGDHVVLDVNGEKLSFVQKLKASGTIRVGKFNVPAAPLIGAPYGSLFEVTKDGKALQRVLLPPADEITRITETEKDNSKLFDKNTENQKLTQAEIEELKKSGKAGAEIIQALCSNSATFQNKTEFSQDKYKRRKAKKYLTYLTVRKPTSRVVCEAHTEKSAERVWNLRHDSLAMMLSLANVAAGAKVLVVESCGGVVTAAAVERLGGMGAVCAVQLDERPAPVDAVRLMNLTPEQRSVLFTAYASSLLRDKELITRGADAALSSVPEQLQQQQQQTSQQPKEEQRQSSSPATEAAAGVAPAASAQEPAATAAATAMDVDAPPAAKEEAATSGQANGGAAPSAMEVEAQGQEPGTSAAAAAGTEAGTEAADAAAGGASGSGDAATAAADATPSEAKGESAAAAGAAQQSKDKRGQQQQQPQQQPQQQRGGYGSFLPRPEVVRSVLTNGFDSVLIALPKVHPTALLDALWPLLAPSATFAIYSLWGQPLAEAMSHLQGSRNAVLLQLQESWLRPYQVLPARTHPHMSCSGTGGFVLSGIKVIPPDATPLGLQLQQQQLGGGNQGQQLRGGGASDRKAAPEGAAAADGAAAEAERRETAGADDADGAKDGGDGEQSPGGSGGGRGRGRGRGGDRDGGGWQGRGGGRGRWGDNGGGRGRGWRDNNGGGGRGGGGRWGGRGRGDGNGGGRGKRRAEGEEGRTGDSPNAKRQAQ